MARSYHCLLAVLFCFTAIKGDDSSYVPCKSYISYSFDDSKTLQYYRQFKSQMSFIKDSIGTFNHPELIQVEGIYSTEFNWNSGLSIAQMQSALASVQQTTNEYSLSKQAAKLLTSVKSLGNVSDPIIAFIFVSNTSDSSLVGAERYISQLNGIKLTLILLGMDSEDLNATKLEQFSVRVIRWYGVDANYPQLFPEDYGCTYYLPCQSYITVLADVSYVFSPSQFTQQMYFLADIFTNVTHFERIQLGIYNDAYGKMLYPWDPANSKHGFKNAVNNLIQNYKPANLQNAITLLNSNLNQDQNQTIPSTALIFVSDTTDDDIINAAVKSYYGFFNNTKLTFILMGDKVDANKLLGFKDAIIFNWKNTNFNQLPDNWDVSQAFQCTPRPTTIVPSLPPPTPINTIPYLPCEGWIGFGIDLSTSIDSTSFKKLLNFVSSAIGVFNHPERISVYHAKFYNLNVIPWNNNFTINEIQNTVTSVTQGPYMFYSIVQKFNTLIYSTQLAPLPISLIIFITDTSAPDLPYIKDYIKSWRPRVRVTFVLTGPNADSAPLRNLSTTYNYIYWPDLSQPQPDNWNALSNLAYGCETLA